MKMDEGWILIGEDQQDDIILLKKALADAGVTKVHVATGGDEVLQYLQGEGEFSDRQRYPFPALLILDLKLPRVSGLEALTWIRKQELIRRLPVVAFTSYEKEDEIDRAYDLGINSLLFKPLDYAGLRSTMEIVTTYWLKTNRTPSLQRARQGKSILEQ